MGGGKQETESKQVNIPAFFQLPRQMQTAGTQLAEWLSGMIGKKAEPYAGDFTAGLAPGEQGLINFARDYPVGDLFGAPEELSRILSGEYLGPNPTMDRYIEAAVNPMRTAYQEDVLPGLQDAAVMAGGLRGTDYPELLTRSGEKFTRAVGDVGANIAGPAYSAELARMLGALQMAPSLSQTPLESAGMVENFLQIPRGIEQGDLTAKYQDFIRQLGGQWQSAGEIPRLIASMLAGGPGEQTSTSTTSDSPGVFDWVTGAAVPLATGGLGAWGQGKRG